MAHYSYYHGSLEADIASIDVGEFPDVLDQIGKNIGYGRAQQILQILWAQHLESKGLPTTGALLKKPLEEE